MCVCVCEACDRPTTCPACNLPFTHCQMGSALTALKTRKVKKITEWKTVQAKTLKKNTSLSFLITAGSTVKGGKKLVNQFILYFMRNLKTG